MPFFRLCVPDSGRPRAAHGAAQRGDTQHTLQKDEMSREISSLSWRSASEELDVLPVPATSFCMAASRYEPFLSNDR